MRGLERNHEQLSEILGLPGQEVTRMQKLEGIGIVLHIQSKQRSAVCPRCGERSHEVHENHEHTIRDLAWGSQEVYLRINARQFKCKGCGKPFTEELDYTPTRRAYTKRYALDVLRQVRGSNTVAVSERSGMSEYQI